VIHYFEKLRLLEPNFGDCLRPKTTPRRDLIHAFGVMNIVVGFYGPLLQNHLIWAIVVPQPGILMYLASCRLPSFSIHPDTGGPDQRLETKAGRPRLRREDFTDEYRESYGYRLYFTDDIWLFTDTECRCLFCVFGFELYADLPYRPDDRALRRHIHLIPPQYAADSSRV
jgi:hypothetical protein